MQRVYSTSLRKHWYFVKNILIMRKIGFIMNIYYIYIGVLGNLINIISQTITIFYFVLYNIYFLIFNYSMLFKK